MSDVHDRHDWDRNPPIPVTEYEQTVQTTNAGYELVFSLTHAVLRALERPDLGLLVVGAGGGKEIADFAPSNPGWSVTGVDPSQNMLDLARAKAATLGLSDRVRLVHGTVADLSPDMQFDAATCIFVLHLLPDNASRLDVLRSIARRLRTAAPLIAVTATRDDASHFDEFAGPLQHYGELMGARREQMVASVERLRARRGALSESQYLDLLRQAGFTSVRRFFSAFTLIGWVARCGDVREG